LKQFDIQTTSEQFWGKGKGEQTEHDVTVCCVAVHTQEYVPVKIPVVADVQKCSGRKVYTDGSMNARVLAYDENEVDATAITIIAHVIHMPFVEIILITVLGKK
jgi:hypothetical protein